MNTLSPQGPRAHALRWGAVLLLGAALAACDDTGNEGGTGGAGATGGVTTDGGAGASGAGGAVGGMGGEGGVVGGMGGDGGAMEPDMDVGGAGGEDMEVGGAGGEDMEIGGAGGEDMGVDAEVDMDAPDMAMADCVPGETRACEDRPDCPQGLQTCVDGVFGPCVGPAELCDELDNDCDGNTDEDFDVGEACEVGLGACAAEGVLVCSGDGEESLCDALPGEPGEEQCNDIDDDCDGNADEGFMVGIPCMGGVGACMFDGMQVCGEDGEVVCNGEAVILPTDEVCDNIDNDCDGTTDEDVPGADETPLNELCSLGLGACESPGIYVCGIDNDIICSTSPGLPVDELCNDIDDDCDGNTDEDFIGENAERPLGEACIAGLGACQNPGTYICDAQGGVQCSAEPLAPQVERCDGEDNDCDGEIDEDFDIDGECLVGIGACAAIGTLICDDLGGTTCQGEPNPPGIETCNGIDDNCNGVTDEGFEVGDPCSEGIGGCFAEGVTVCNAQGEIVCSETEGPPIPEACNGIDDDCDGAIDEDLLSLPDEDNPQDAYRVGEACLTGLGACVTEGVGVCSGNPDQEVLSFSGIRNDLTVGEVEAGGFELCWVENYQEGQTPIIENGLDPETEEEVISIQNRCPENVLMVGCRERDSDFLHVAAIGERDAIFEPSRFADREPQNEHNGVNWYFNINYAWGYSPVGAELDVFTCDRVQDGSNQRVCWYTSDDKVRPGYRCGDQLIFASGLWERFIFQRVGTLTRGAIGEVVCEADPVAPGVEACNGEDEDCDGSVDEDFPLGEACTNGVGECTAEGVNVCDGNGDFECNAVPLEASPELCDGLDNDCDGSIDEDFPVEEDCEAGNGACVASGEFLCDPEDPSRVICDAVPLEPRFDEICNFFDDDCDGLVDEGLGNCNLFSSCKDALENGEEGSGAIEIRPNPQDRAYTVHCDQNTDGGGWTLVASSRERTIDDQGGEYGATLTTVYPGNFNLKIWNGLRDLSENFDIRFACRAEPSGGGAPFDVDLSFYDNDWYHTLTEGFDRDSCFYPNPDIEPQFVAGQPPARRNNISGEELPAGDDWEHRLIAEDRCQDGGDFVIDFDDGGGNPLSNPNDGTDWGEYNGTRRCGVSNLPDGQWFIFVRERD
ncbi:MAG: MopE-related protein [Bradymonadia bacterium]